MDDGYTAIFREHRDALVRGATLAAGGDQALAEDAVVEAFLRTYPHWRRGRIDDIGRYLRTTTVHEVRRLQGRAARTVPQAEVAVTAVPLGARPGPTSAENAVDDRSEVVALLAGLSPDERHVLVLRYWFDLREADVADALGLPLGTVKSHAHRALRRLRTATRGGPDA